MSLFIDDGRFNLVVREAQDPGLCVEICHRVSKQWHLVVRIASVDSFLQSGGLYRKNQSVSCMSLYSIADNCQADVQQCPNCREMIAQNSCRQTGPCSFR